MDAPRFDAIVRNLAAPSARRGVLAALVAGALAFAPLSDTAARKKRRCRPACGPCQRCERGKCRKTKSGKKRCKPSRCVASPPRTVNCGGACANLMTDPRNCGSCGKRCTLNASCVRGVCTCASGSVCPVVGSCCNSSPGSILICSCAPSGGATFDDPTSPICATVAACPAGTTQCVGVAGTCQACCPAGSTCDPGTGTCLQ